jgi:hypothetical protein
MRTILILLLACLAGIGVGLLAAIKLDAPTQLYDRISYHVRDGLKLEKNWVKLPGPEQAEGRTERSCPSPDKALVLVIGGQSNASNAIPVRYDAKRDVSVWFDGRCFPASDPILGATASGGSLWSLLGDRLEENLDRPILLIVGAVGGTQFSDWLDPRSGYYKALMQRVSSAYEADYRPDMILWHQGETDAAAERNLEKLKNDVIGLTNRLLTDISAAPLYLFQASICMGDYRINGVPKVIEVLQQAAAANPRIIKGMNTDTLGRDYRWDTCHFNSIAREAIVNQIVPDLVSRLRTEQ